VLLLLHPLEGRVLQGYPRLRPRASGHETFLVFLYPGGDFGGRDLRVPATCPDIQGFGAHAIPLGKCACHYEFLFTGSI
jgi:hypothetical protein